MELREVEGDDRAASCGRSRHEHRHRHGGRVDQNRIRGYRRASFPALGAAPADIVQERNDTAGPHSGLASSNSTSRNRGSGRAFLPAYPYIVSYGSIPASATSGFAQIIAAVEFGFRAALVARSNKRPSLREIVVLSPTPRCERAVPGRRPGSYLLVACFLGPSHDRGAQQRGPLSALSARSSHHRDGTQCEMLPVEFREVGPVEQKGAVGLGQHAGGSQSDKRVR